MQRLVLVLLLCLGSSSAQALTELRVDHERTWLRGKPAEAVFQLRDEQAQPVSARATLRPDGRWEDATGSVVDTLALRFDAQGRTSVEGIRVVEGSGHFVLTLDTGEAIDGRVRVVHPLWSLLPPLLSIVLALWLRQVLLALTMGIVAGAWIMAGDPIGAFTTAVTGIVAQAMADEFQASILLFTAILGGMVGVMAKAGGTHGLVDLARRSIRDARGAQLSAAILGLIIFFDDYANTLLVGNTMRPVTDKLRVSREKLSYLVDSTAAPVATVAGLSTWVGYQVGLIGDGLKVIDRTDMSAYATFLAGVPYAAYSWFALVLLFMLVLTRRDFGPMLRAERRARATGAVLGDGARPLTDDIGSDLQPVEGKPRHASLALVPIVVVLVTTVIGLWADGRRQLVEQHGVVALERFGLREIFSAADPAASLLWAVVVGATLAIALSVARRVVDLQSALDAFVSGAKAMVPALIILILAWSIGDVCERLGTANVVVDASTGNLSAHLVPTVTFVVAAFLGFSTGTSWGTMAILMPIVIPLAHALPASAGVDPSAASSIFLASVACVLSGSVFGDHCSPISDTTIMSSMASGADHVDHVRTQLPYALTAGAFAVLFGTLPAGFGLSPWLTLPCGVVALGLVVFVLGKPSEASAGNE